jgi:hypothetical protein
MRKGLLIVAGVLVVLCGAGGWMVYSFMSVGKQITESSLTQAEFDAQKVGAEEVKVRDALPEAMESDEKEIYGDADPSMQGKPAGSTCAYYVVKPLTESGEKPLFRFCFADGKLAEKKQIRVAG